MVSELKSLLAPGSLTLLLLAIAAGLAVRRFVPWLARAARLWIAAWLVLYLMLSLPAVAQQIYRGLDEGDPILSADQAGGSQMVVMLSGSAAWFGVGDQTIPLMDMATSLRVLETARVYHLLGSPLVVVSGAGPDGERSSEVRGMRAGLIAAGVPPDRILLESASRDTHASALAVAQLLRSRNASSPVLVTSSQHMRRALRAFRKAGVDPIVSPAPLPRVRARQGWRGFVPDADALQLSETCLHEYAGIAYYWLRGWS
jgi:uncharacterized SAM-binding protein YcdF (DUF218 family)